MRQPVAGLGRVELEILHFVADHHPITVGAVARHIADTSGQARTTVLTVMERLRRKGYLTRRKVQRVYQYSPKVAMPALLQSLVGEFVSGVLGGSVSPFVAWLNNTRELSEQELARLRAVVSELQAHSKRGPP